MGVATPLVTDLYEVTMALAYLKKGLTAPATFSLFARALPAERGSSSVPGSPRSSTR